MKKVCLIYANCQNALLTKYLYRSQPFKQEYLIKRFPVHRLMEKGTTIPNHLLQQAKLFIYQPVKDVHGDLSTKIILNKLPADCQPISFPPLYFTGYYPQICKHSANKLNKPNYPFEIFPHGDSNINSMLAERKSVPEIIERLTSPDFYSQEFLLANLNRTLAELARRESQLNIKVSNFIKAQYQHHYLFYTQNHPSDILGIYVVNQILNLINLPGLGDALSFENLNSGVLDGIQIPIYPSVIKHLNLAFVDDNTVYKNAGFCTNRMTLAKYINEYVYHHSSGTQNANLYYLKGIYLTNKSKLKQATVALRQALRLREDNAAYYGQLADILHKQKKLDRAETVYKKAINLSPDWINFYISLSNLLIEKNNSSAALTIYKQAININPENDELHSLLGKVLIERGNLDLAQTAYEKALELNPYNSLYYQRLGNIYRNQGNLEQAIVHYKKAIVLASNNPWLYIHLIEAFVECNKLDEAISMSQQVMQLRFKNPSFYFQLGNLQISIEDVDNALNSYQKAIKLNPSYTPRIFAQIKNLLREKTNNSVYIPKTDTAYL